MSRKSSSRIKNVLFVVLSFVLSLVLFGLSLSVVLEATVFNSDFILENMNSSNYYSDKKDEITLSLTDLGYASGLDESFFDGIVDEVMLNANTQEYLQNYYSGEGTKIDVTQFKQVFNSALDTYIEDNSIESVDGTSREYLVTRAATVYERSLEIPLFSKISAYFLKIRKAMPFVIAGLILFAAIIVAIFFVANKWKHRAVKFCYYACAAAFLALGIIPLTALVTGQFEKVNITSRALYNLFVNCGNSVMIAILFCSLLFLVIAFALFFLHKKMRAKLTD
jgi:hypothetical protein